MSKNLVHFEVRTSRSAQYPTATAVQLLATLPPLKHEWWHQLMAQSETLSWELRVTDQLVVFGFSCSPSLATYLQGLIQASYPEALVTEVTADPIANIITQHPERHLQIAVGQLKNQDYLPLKTYQEFGEAEPLVGLLSTLSQVTTSDSIVIQYVLGSSSEHWKTHGAGQAATPDHPQKALIDSKLKSRSFEVSARVLVQSENATRTKQLLDSVSAALQSLSGSGGNQLIFRAPFLWQPRLRRQLLARQVSPWASFHLNLEELATLFHFPDQRLSHISNVAWGKRLLGEPPENLPIAIAQGTPAEKSQINAFAQAEFKGSKAIYGLKRNDRRRHLYVIGKTGTGKSTLLANMAINDLKNDEGLCVIDPHGDLVETLLNYIPSRRLNDVVYFDPSDPERTVKINLFEGENVVHRELIASGIVSIFRKLYAYSWGPRLEYILRNALLTLLKSPQARMSDILDLLTTPSFREKIVANLDDPILKSFWVNEYDVLQDKQRNEAIAPILNKVGQFVSSPLVRNVVNAHKSSFSIEKLMNERKILLVNLSQGRLGEDNAALLGAMLITKIQLAAMSRVHIPEEDRQDFYLYVDEFQNFATESFIKILSEARKYRLNLTLANQYIAQIPEEVQKAIFGNCGSVISFVMGADDAATFAKEYANKYTPEDLVSLGKHQIINKIAIDNLITPPFPAQTLPLAKSSNQNRDKVIRNSRERYATNKEAT